MDCCKIDKEEKYSKNLETDIIKKEIGGKIMNKRIALWGIISVLFIATLILTFKAGMAGNIETAQVVSSASKGVAQSYGGMVGGC